MSLKKMVLFIAVLILSSQSVFAATKKVTVSLPPCQVILNNKTVDNSHRAYPLITYKGITYFPMTYSDCRFLGLESQWDNSTGLNIEKTGVVAEYAALTSKVKNRSSYSAEIPSFNISINGRTIDNTQEKYPLLSFRNITYFPLTWDFAVDAFGWDYEYTPELGLSIHSKQLNPEKLNLPYADLEYNQPQIIDESIYYASSKESSDDTFKINWYKTPLNAPENTKKIHTVEYEDFALRPTSFYKREEDVYFSYYTGGATMGSNHQYKIVSEEGAQETSVEVSTGKNTFTPFENSKIWVNYFTPPYPGNLSIEKEGQHNPLGNPNYIYGWAKTDTGSFSGGTVVIDGNALYINASDSITSTTLGFLCKIDLKTGDNQTVLQYPVSQLTVEKNRLIFINALTHQLCLKDLATDKETILLEHPINYFVRTSQVIVALDQETHTVHYIDSNWVAKPLLSEFKFDGFYATDKYLILNPSEGEPYGLMVTTLAGDIIFKTSDPISNASISNNVMLYSTQNSFNAYKIILP